MSADLAKKVELLETEIERLHSSLQAQGINSKGTTDIQGRPFELPVDAEHKAIIFTPKTLFSCANPHMRGFWSATLGFFSTFFSTFAAAPLMAYIKMPESLNLAKSDILSSNIASVAGTIGMRLVTGWLCDKIGARRAFVFLLWLAIPGIVGIAFTTNAAGFITCRFIIGLSLATFVTCQVWCSQLFTKSVVGAANATAGGWGNLGGGVTNLVMPYIMLGFLNATGGDVNISWRLCYIVPLGFHLLSGLYILTGRDLPDGNFAELELSGAKQKAKSGTAVKTGFSNVNAWILTLTYGFCFGVELTMTNVAALYFYTYHGMSPQIAGVLASMFGLMNIFARSWGGIISDAMNAKFGMRGRIWAMWVVQVVEGFMCIVMGLVTINMASPDDGRGMTTAMFTLDGTNYQPKDADGEFYPIKVCGNNDIGSSAISGAYDPATNMTYTSGQLDLPARVMIGDLENMDCIRNKNIVGLTVFIMIIFSICVQMAEGLHFGVVPYVSRPALGVVSGMVGAGGNGGAVLTLWTIFKNTAVARTDSGFIILGIVIIATSLSMFGIYFPDTGGMLFKAGGLGSYDPQRIKPPSDFRGADQMDYSQNQKEAGKGPPAA